MIIRKLYNFRKDLTETRNNTRAAIRTLTKVSSMIGKMSGKMSGKTDYDKAVRKAVTSEFRRRDIWDRAASETRHLAKGRPVWVIKCPDGEERLKSDIPFRADYAYCSTLKKYLEREGIYVVLQMYDDWYCDVGADVEIHIGCRREYHPDRRVPGRVNVMWLVSHPENVPDEVADRYDLILVDSVPLANEMKHRTTAEVEPFLVAVDTDYFYRDDSPEEYERVFVGNTRGYNRNCVKWCSENKIELDVWGKGWEKNYTDNPYIHLHGCISYDQTADIYRRAKVIINEHHPTMKQTGMINNRCPEVLLCGKTMLCDWSQGVYDEFGELFTYYHDENDFIEALGKAEESYEILRREVEDRNKELLEKYSFDTGIKRMVDLISRLQSKPGRDKSE